MSTQLPPRRTADDPHAGTAHAEQVLRRICTEYTELPGLRLTFHQAQRLWGLDEQTCASLLGFLVEAKFLTLVDNRLYARFGTAPAPSRRMAKVESPRPVTGRRRAGH